MGSVATDTFRPGASATESRATGGPAKPDARAHRSATRLFEPGGVTLEDVVLGAWDDLVADGDAECPACGGRMSMLTGCEECGSELS